MSKSMADLSISHKESESKHMADKTEMEGKLVEFEIQMKELQTKLT